MRRRDKTSKWLTKLVAGNAASLSDSLRELSRLQVISLNLSALSFAVALVPVIMAALIADMADDDQPLRTHANFKNLNISLQIGTYGFLLGIGLIIGCVMNVTLVNVGKLLFS
jgi:hypothetical protein